MIKNILESTIAARESFFEDPTISSGMTWAYNVSRLVVAANGSFVDPDMKDLANAEVSAYIRYKE